MVGGMALLCEGSASPWSVLGGVAAVLVLWWAMKVLEWAWWAPRRVERALRAQGMRGNRYRFLWGDLKEEGHLNTAGLARPVRMDRPHDIIPRVFPFLHHVVQEHGKVSLTWFGTIPRIVITDPELAREVLLNKDGCFVRTKMDTKVMKFLTGGIGTLDAEKWAKHRRILNPAFHVEKLKGMLPAFSAAYRDRICIMENLIADSVGTKELDIWPELSNLTGDAISRAVFGASYQEGRPIFRLQAEQADRAAQAFKTIHIPGYSLLPTENNRKMKAIDRETKAILRGIIEKRLEAMKNSEHTKGDLLGLILESNMKYTDSGRKSSRGITLEEVIDECKTFYLAGWQPATVLLTWTVVVLSMHPEWQDQARDEVLGVFGQNNIDFGGLSHLKVVTMVLYEVLRLYPPAQFLNRRIHKQTKLGGVSYPPDTMLVVPIMFVHRDPAFWGDDVGEFNPRRFAEGMSKACRDPSAYIPFGSGPRICIGQNFALLQAKLAISMILQRFAFELSTAYVHAPYNYKVLSLPPQHAVLVRLRRL